MIQLRSTLEHAIPASGVQTDRNFRLSFRHLHEENRYRVLRLLDSNPHMSQREIALALGVSVGKANYCLKALLEKGLIKVQNFRNAQNKLAYAYWLTPAGLREKTGLTARFLERKMAEYEMLRRDIELLKAEVDTTLRL